MHLWRPASFAQRDVSEGAPCTAFGLFLPVMGARVLPKQARTWGLSSFTPRMCALDSRGHMSLHTQLPEERRIVFQGD